MAALTRAMPIRTCLSATAVATVVATAAAAVIRA
jgi:hypothetical protein